MASIGKSYNGPYGHTYYRRDGVLMGHPTNADETCDFDPDVEIPVEDFAEPLTAAELADVEAALA